MNSSLALASLDQLATLALAQPGSEAGAAPATGTPAAGAPAAQPAAQPVAPSGGADMMGGTAAPGTPGGVVVPGTATPGAPAAPRSFLSDPMTLMLLVFAPMLILMIFTSGRKAKREAAKRQELINSVRKNDTVLTVAGIKGTVAENPEGKDEVVLIVDELTRTRIRFAKTAITQVIREGSGSTVEAKTGEVVGAAG
jgi:preprotein translocase YajC subunit